MDKKVYFRAFQTGVGGAAHYITKKQWRQSAGREKTDVTFDEGFEIWFSYPRKMNRNAAKDAVMNAFNKWVQTKPSVAEIRRAVRNEEDVSDPTVLF